jgi:hypothetical protein
MLKMIEADESNRWTEGYDVGLVQIRVLVVEFDF